MSERPGAWFAPQQSERRDEVCVSRQAPGAPIVRAPGQGIAAAVLEADLDHASTLGVARTGARGAAVQAPAAVAGDGVRERGSAGPTALPDVRLDMDEAGQGS